MKMIKSLVYPSFFIVLVQLLGCSSSQSLPPATTYSSLTESVADYKYLIGPGDRLSIFVWRNPEISGAFIVRPDGKVSTSLVEDIDVAGKTPTELARHIEEELSKFINSPRVTVSVTGFVGPYSEQVRVIGEASNPTAISYSQNMTLLDVMIEVGGLTEFAAGNSAKLIRTVKSKQVTYDLDIDSLIKDGDISKNVDILPGDIIIVPEAWF